MSDYQALREIMEELTGTTETTEEQQEEANHSRFEDSDIQEELREWQQQESEQVDREPPELGREV